MTGRAPDSGSMDRGCRDRVLPDFPDPVPQPSARMALPADFIDVLPMGRSTLHDVARALDDLLTKAGYSQRSYFRLTHRNDRGRQASGFALVTRMERIRADGAPFPPEERFTAAGAPDQFSVMSFLSSLFVAPVGYYRVIVFFVSTQEVRSSHRAMSRAEANALLATGNSRLRGCVAQLPYDYKYDLSAYIYEFRHAPEDANAEEEAVRQLKPSLIDPGLHLRKAGLLDPRD